MLARNVIRVVLGLALAAGVLGCGGRRADGPAWPKSAGALDADEKDGEPLDPQHASNVAAVERAEDRTPAADPEAAVVVEAVPPVEIPPLPAKDEAKDPDKPPAGEVQIEVIEIKPEDIEVEP